MRPPETPVRSDRWYRDRVLMLLLLAGSAASGKSTVLPHLHSMPSVVTHDFDEGGVPPGADTAWRQQRLEQWVQYAVQRQQHGIDVVLAGQSPLGELIACPSAPQLDSMAAVLIDVDDGTRLERLRRRDGTRWSPTQEAAFLGWAGWHRDHATDPQRRQEVLTWGGWPPMCWQRWTSWQAGDPRWQVARIDTMNVVVTDVAEQVHTALHRVRGSSGAWPLTGTALIDDA